jgi:retron-type reverse transcriptase
MSTDSVSLLESYLSNRKQQIKINGILSSWSDIQKGVPQGLILDPLLFNVFINDIFYFVKKGTLYNYADDNTLSYGHPLFPI